ncbi:MAG: GDSL-type esterase/lipase family protein [Bacteroidota bacterium]
MARTERSSLPLTPGKRVAFSVFAVALPVLLLAGIEGVGRLAGLAPERLPFEAVGEDERVLSPAFAERYFNGFSPAVPYTPFAAEPARDTFRIVALGGSTTAGFPYQFYSGFPTRIGERLMQAMPSRQIEVINLAMTAVNSYTIWDLAPDVVALDPDVVVIYAGHNEYYGALGVGSTHNGWADAVSLKRLVLKLRRTVVYTLLERVLAGGEADQEARTTMAGVVRDAEIGLDSDAYRAGIEQFEQNLSDTLQRFDQASIPVHIATVTSNLSGQAPLGESEQALEAYEAGNTALSQGNPRAAQEAFERAKDLDGLRFRAPNAINTSLRGLASETGAVLVDVDAELRAAYRSGLPGDTLFVDHLHFTAEGYDRIAGLFVDSFVESGLVPERAAQAETVPADAIDEAYAALQITRLKADAPFMIPGPEAEAQIQQLRAELTAASQLGGLAVDVSDRTVLMPDALVRGIRAATIEGDSVQALLMARGLTYWRNSDTQDARKALEQSLASPALDSLTAPSAAMLYGTTREPFYANASAAAWLRTGELDAAGVWLSETERRTPDDPVLLFNFTRYHLARGDTASARPYAARYQETRRLTN